MTKYIDHTDDYIMQLSKLQVIDDELVKLQSCKPSIIDQLNAGNSVSILEEVRSIKMDIKQHIQEIENMKSIMKEHYDKQLAQIREKYEQQLQNQRQTIYNQKQIITSLQSEKQQHKTSSLLSDSLKNSLEMSLARSLTAVKNVPEQTLEQNIITKNDTSIEAIQKQIAKQEQLIKEQESKLNASMAKDKFLETLNDSFQREMYYQKKCHKLLETLAEQTELQNQKQQQYRTLIIQMEAKITALEHQAGNELKVQQITKINEKQQEIITKQQQELIKQNEAIQKLREQVNKFNDIQENIKSNHNNIIGDEDEQTNDVTKLFFKIQTLKQVIEDQDRTIIKTNQQNRLLNQQILELKTQLFNGFQLQQ